jgi:hypothetical protein
MLEHDYPPSLTKIRKRFLCKLGYHKWEPIRRINGQYGKICFGCDPVKEWWEPLPSFRSKGSEVMSKQ